MKNAPEVVLVSVLAGLGWSGRLAWRGAYGRGVVNVDEVLFGGSRITGASQCVTTKSQKTSWPPYAWQLSYVAGFE